MKVEHPTSKKGLAETRGEILTVTLSETFGNFWTFGTLDETLGETPGAILGETVGETLGEILAQFPKSSKVTKSLAW